MNRPYNNFVQKLEEWDCKMLTSPEAFAQDKRFSYECSKHHISSLSIQSFINKTATKKLQGLKSLCAECNDYLLAMEDIHGVLDKLGFTFLGYTKDKNGNRIVRFKCVCGAESQSDFRNLKKPTRQAQCIKCQNNNRKVDYTDIQKEFLDRGCILLTPASEYINNKMKLKYRCQCGEEAEIVLNDLRRGRLCMLCRGERTKETCMEKYNVENTFQAEVFKERSRQTNIERLGVPYPQQSEVVRSKTEKTSLEKYGVKRAFCLPEVYQKIRKIHKEKYGVEYPLQCKEIQEKIDVIFQQNIGAKRPFLSDSFLAQMEDKYGHKFFGCTERYKEIMLDKYGAESFVESEAFRQQMLDKYGTEYFIQSEECKKQMLEKYGVEHYIQSDSFKTQMLDKYGTEYFIQSEECKRQMLEKYGVEHYIQSDSFKTQMLDKYGVEHAMQNPDLFRKAQRSSFKRKPYVWDGQTFMVLGYEDRALEDLFSKEGSKVVYAGEDENIPVFEYFGDDGKYHTYYPDMFMPLENRFIEVKSVYTYNKNPSKTLQKAIRVSEDHLFELWIYNHKAIVEILECRYGFFYSRIGGKLILGEPYTEK